MGEYTLTVKTQEGVPVLVVEYDHYMSGTAMMDEAKYYRRLYPDHIIEW